MHHQRIVANVRAILRGCYVSKLILTLAGLLLGFVTANAAGQESRPATKPADTPKVIFPLAQVPKQPIPKYTRKQLVKMWPAFEHAPFKTAGFNHLSLPLRFISLDGTGNPVEGNAFAFLLSDMLDWTPGNYCARHAYFVFKSSRKEMKPFLRQYDRRVIKKLVREWFATHAVGGVLIQSKKGYSGILEIYDDNGRLVHKKDYRKHRKFFDLLGDMCVDAMRFFGHEPSAEMTELVHFPQCEHRESLIDLGNAAFLRRLSPEAFSLYEKILQRDPEFVNVRDWWSNQAGWADYGRSEKKNVDRIPPKHVNARYKQLHSSAPEVTGPYSPSFLHKSLESVTDGKTELTPDLLARAMPMASKYPNEFRMLYELGDTYYQSIGDNDMAASVFLTAMRNRFLVAIDHKKSVKQGFALAVMRVGRNDVAARVLFPLMKRLNRSGGPKRAATTARWLATALKQMQRYPEALKAYEFAVKGMKKGHQRNQALAEMGVAAAMAGRLDKLNDIIRDYRVEIATLKRVYVLEAYRDSLMGKEIDLKAFLHKTMAEAQGRPWETKMCALRFYFQQAVMDGVPHFRNEIRRRVQADFHDRSFQILFHLYEKMAPREDSANFYEALDWLHGEDPWVIQAMEHYRQRSTARKLTTDEELAEYFKDFEPMYWPKADPSRRDQAIQVIRSIPPGAVTVVVRDLIAEGDLDRAEELTRRYLNIAVNYCYSVRSHAYHLLNKVKQARKKTLSGSISPISPGNAKRSTA